METTETSHENTASQTPVAETAPIAEAAPAPELDWSDLGLAPELLELIAKAGYRRPTPVQAQSIPLVVAGNDVLVSSQTGSGKTASFVLPTVQRFKGRDGTFILALSPTREIAQQTGAVFETFGAPLGLRTVVCIGGASIPLEKEALASSPHIIVATPGRLCDHLERGNVWLDFIQCLIFDEADRMLDMGFQTQIDMITEQIPKERQTLMFSATFAPSVERLARNAMRDPKQVTIGKTNATAPKIEQDLLWMPEEKKLGALMRIMREESGTIIVFARSKERVSQIWRSLHAKKIYEATYIHSDCTQEHREGAIADFKSGKFRVLIATDVAGRGIDVESVGHVVNFDIPREAEDYVHRIGRTGRAGKTGRATSFAIPHKDEEGVRAIEKLLGIPSPERPPREARAEGQTDRPRREGERRDGRRDGGRGRDGERRPRSGGQEARGPRQERGPRPEGQPTDSQREPRFVLNPDGTPVLGPDGQPLLKRRRSRGGRGRSRGEERAPRAEGQQTHTRGPRPHGEGERPRRDGRPHEGQRRPGAETRQAAAPLPPKKTGGFMGWVKSLFGG